MLTSFAALFQVLWGYDPFPWQAMLAEKVAEGTWPQAIDLPTAAGKTACLDIAVYALAAQAHRPLAERTAPRRIWFVVDRRIVVDEAYERARALAEKLAAATEGPLKWVADRLRRLSGTGRPLAVARLRGGILRDDGWARIPSQPAIITSTVDQLGSRLLFRGYGHSLLAAPIFAGLAANDSLIILDEAHCAVPFMQTLRSIERYRGGGWAESPLQTPFAFVVMSATPPAEVPAAAVFPGPSSPLREQALAHPELHRRLRTAKRAELVLVKPDGHLQPGSDPLVSEAACRAWDFVRAGRRRVAVMVNRVRTAVEIAEKLREMLADTAHVVLLTGRIRPLERDELVERWAPYLCANRPREPEKPVVAVSTQCLEVGADFSFDALVTECASLDALRQRFGRLARLGAEEAAPAAILVREADIEEGEPDPIYGDALRRTWGWLWENAVEEDGGRAVDFGVEALEARVREVEDLSMLLAPAENAPVLLPAHLDLLCQTAPPPHPDPDVSLFLHGRPGPPEVAVVWRSDLSPSDTETWTETVALCPPVSGEMLSVPLWRLRAWLAQIPTEDEGGDVEGAGGERGVATEGAGGEGEIVAGRIRPCLLWRGRDRSRVTASPEEILPGDVVVVPAAYGIAGVGQATGGQAAGSQATGAEGLDLWEAARARSGRPAALRVQRAAVAPWLGYPPLKELLERCESPAWDRHEVEEAIAALLGYQPSAEEAAVAPPGWWLDVLRSARGGRMEKHPAGGLVFFARETAAVGAAGEQDLFADDDDLTSAADREVTLEEHAALVRRAAARLAERCLPAELRPALELAAEWHDAGKLDERFQVMLHQGDEVAAAAAAAPLAKSGLMPVSPVRRRAVRAASGLPPDFRHEMLSCQLAQRFGALPQDEGLAELALHLIASHHGHGRPWAPVCLDPAPPPVAGRLRGTQIEVAAADRAAAPPPHRADSGVTARFWRLTRRFGWWGLAYLEAVLRLADWYGSRFAILGAAGKEENEL